MNKIETPDKYYRQRSQYQILDSIPWLEFVTGQKYAIFKNYIASYKCIAVSAINY